MKSIINKNVIKKNISIIVVVALCICACVVSDNQVLASPDRTDVGK